MEPHKCDDLVLGSSPASVLEAATLAKQGRQVVVAEAGPDIGGVWAGVRIGEHTFADRAPHLIDARPGAYEFLSDQLGLELVDVTRDAYAAFATPLFGRRLYPYTEYWLAGMYAGDNRRIYRVWSDAGYTIDAVKARLHEAWLSAGVVEERGSTLKYFKGGTEAFARRLGDLLDRYRVEAFTNRRISMVEWDAPSGRWIGYAAGFALAAKSVVMNAHAFPDTIVHDGTATLLERTQQPTYSLFLTLEGNTADPFFYALFPESSLIHLAADTGYWGGVGGEAKRVIVATPHNAGLAQYDSAEAICLAVVEELRGSGLISPSSRLVSVDGHGGPRACLQESAMKRAAGFSGVRVVDSRGGLDHRLVALLRSCGAKLAA